MAGWSACGSVMDCVRSCYQSQMRLYRDRPDVLTPGRWIFCPPGAVSVPYFHLFGSSNYDHDGRFDPPVGEVGTGPHPWSNGKVNPRYLGQNTCGSAEQWLTGSAFASQGTPAVDADGVPLCCVALPIMGGGDADGGECVQNWGFAQTADGGDGDDGQAMQYAGGYQLAQGGDSDGGHAVQYGGARQVADGGDSDDGQAVQTLGNIQVAGGGDSDDGQAVQALGNIQVAGGGDSDDGAAVQHGGWVQVASGGDGDDGEADQERENDTVWLKYTLTFTDFQTAGTTKTVAAWPGVAKGFLHDVLCNVTTDFTGPGITLMNCDALYDTAQVWSLWTMAAGQKGREYRGSGDRTSNLWPSGVVLGMGSLTGAKPFNIKMTATGANLSALTAGSMEIYVNVSTLP